MFKKIVGLWFSTKGKNAKDVEKYIKNLVDGWANEFFTGYNPSYWSDKFGFEVSPNGRFAEHEQITDFETLKAIVREVHKYDLEVFINLNAWYYTDETMPFIQRMVDEFETVWVDGIICGNIGILEYLQSRNYQGLINISTIMAVYNIQAIEFFLENYDINKIILSREITLKEIEKLVTSFPNTKFEVFGEGDFCRYNNGLCFAEHKYGAKDICTIVVNDLIIKKKFRPDFKEILQDTNLSNQQKLAELCDEYRNIFQEIHQSFELLELGLLDSGQAIRLFHRIVKQNNKRVDLYFDAMKNFNDEHNQRVIIFLKALKYLLTHNTQISRDELSNYLDLEIELEKSIRSGMEFKKKQAEKIWWEAKLVSQELARFYAKSDNLNLYSYLFFSQFKNIETVKFPTRGRNYNEKIKIIEETLKNHKVDNSQINRGVSITRAHYDLTYLFWEKLWFREILKDI